MTATKSKNHLAAIHIAQKTLGLSAEDAAALKLSVTGVVSAKDMSLTQQRRYLAHLSTLQATVTKARGETPAYIPKPRPASANGDAMWAKARAIWDALAVAGEVRVNTDEALIAYVKRQTDVDQWRWLNGRQCSQVIEALKKWAARKGVALGANG